LVTTSIAPKCELLRHPHWIGGRRSEPARGTLGGLSTRCSVRLQFVLVLFVAIVACRESKDVITVDVAVDVEAEAGAVPFGVLVDLRQDCGLENDGVLSVCQCEYDTGVDLVRLRYSGNGVFRPPFIGSSISQGNLMRLRFDEMEGAYSAKPIYGFTPQLESRPDDPPQLIDEDAILEGNTVTIRYQTADGTFVNETHVVQQAERLFIDRPGHSGVDCALVCD
jgi:hypothetical protein